MMDFVVTDSFSERYDALTDDEASRLDDYIELLLEDHEAAWARQNLVNQGLLSGSSPRGIWEITEQGRNYLAALTP